MKPNPEKLQCISIIVCNDIYRDERSKNLVLCGTFNQVVGKKFPCRVPRMSVLVTLTNGLGNYDLRISVEHEASGVEILVLDGTAIISDPLSVQDVHVQMNEIVFEKPGKYWVVVKADNEILQQRPLQAVLQLEQDFGNEKTDDPD